MIAKAYRVLVAFKDTIVEAYIRGTADEAWGLRHPPKEGEPVCGFCDRHVEDAEAAHARGVQEERARWTEAVKMERAQWRPDERPGAGYVRGTLSGILIRMGLVSGPVDTDYNSH